MPLSLLVGPANAGKVARLLDRYLENLEREPFLVVPNRAEVDRVERDLLARRPALLGGTIGTFDDLFELLARGDGRRPPVATESQRALVLRRALAGASLNGLGPSARFSGFGETLLAAISELESGLVDPSDLHGDLALASPLFVDSIATVRDLAGKRVMLGGAAGLAGVALAPDATSGAR